MAAIVFYEKPGCKNNTLQKAILEASGHSVQAENLLTQSWTGERLRPFFGEMPVAQWFNKSAPRIKSGEVVPADQDEVSALNAMVADPLLIRRPLMQVEEGGLWCGFDRDALNEAIGLKPLPGSPEDIETCPKGHEAKPCLIPVKGDLP